MASNRLIDLFSDTATRPSPGMRKAMAEAEVGDEQKAEDPTTNALQDRVAALLGKEAAVFLPSGTMCNQIALLVHCRPGDEVIGPPTRMSSPPRRRRLRLCRRADTRRSRRRAGHLQRAPRSTTDPPATPRHNPLSKGWSHRADRQSRRRRHVAARPHRGGASQAARRHGLIVHMDGARILNAVVARRAAVG